MKLQRAAIRNPNGKAFLILGDSWAVGHPHNFISDYGHDNGLSMDQLFQQKGYEVSNQSTYGCSNIETLTAGIQYMKYRAPQLPKIKLVIFFLQNYQDIKIGCQPLGYGMK